MKSNFGTPPHHVCEICNDDGLCRNNIFSTKYQLSCLLFAKKIDVLLVNQQKISQLKLKVNKIWLKRYLVITKYFGGSDPANMLKVQFF